MLDVTSSCSVSSNVILKREYCTYICVFHLLSACPFAALQFQVIVKINQVFCMWSINQKSLEFPHVIVLNRPFFQLCFKLLYFFVTGNSITHS